MNEDHHEDQFNIPSDKNGNATFREHIKRPFPFFWSFNPVAASAPHISWAKSFKYFTFIQTFDSLVSTVVLGHILGKGS